MLEPALPRASLPQASASLMGPYPSGSKQPHALDVGHMNTAPNLLPRWQLTERSLNYNDASSLSAIGGLFSKPREIASIAMRNAPGTGVSTKGLYALPPFIFRIC